MYRRLPVNPSLDHLKHQAKDLLRGLRAGEPEALERAAAHLPERKQGEPPTLADAQFVIAREYYFWSWPKLKGQIEEREERRSWQERDAAEADRPEVGLASCILLGAMETPIPQFSLQREGTNLLMAQPDGYVCNITEFLPACPGGEHFVEPDSPLPTEAVWERFLAMSNLTDPAATAGTIQIACDHRFPHTDWTITVTREKPDKLDFSLFLDRVDTTMPTSWG